MSVQSVNVTCTILDSSGNPVPGANVVFQLIRTLGTPDGILLSTLVSVTTDSNGVAVAELYPYSYCNSPYNVYVSSPDNQYHAQGTAYVLSEDCTLAEIFQPSGNLPVSLLETSVTECRVSASNARLSAVASLASEEESEASASNAGLSAVAAAVSAVLANTSAGNAQGFANSSASSAAGAASSLGTVTTELAAFQSLYFGAYASDSAANASGKTAIVGSEYFNTTESKLRVCASISPTVWADYDSDAITQAIAAAASASQAYTYSINAFHSASGAAGSATTATAEAGNSSASAAASLASKQAASNANLSAIAAKGVASNAAIAASASASAASSSASAASGSAAAAAASVAALTATSTTSLAVATGAQTFATQAGKRFVSGQLLQIASAGTPTAYMHGQVTSYSGTSLVMNVLDTGGSGTHADWNIAVSGTQGPMGATGSTGTNGQGVPTGGTAGQSLTKIDGTNYNTHWTNVTASGSPISEAAIMGGM